MAHTVSASDLAEMEAALLALDRVAAQRILAGFAPPLPALRRVEGLIVPVLERIGRGWDEGRVSLSQVYMSGRLCEQIVDQVLPPVDPSRKDFPPTAIATLEDYHLLGLRIVYSALRAAGFSLLNYGRADLETLAARVEADGIRILLVSVLMLPSALRIKALKARLAQSGHRPRIIVGGAPFRFDERLWLEVGADAVGYSAGAAVEAVVRQAGELA